MKNFDDFRKSMKDQYFEYHQAVNEQAENFCAGSDLTPFEESVIHSEVATMEMLKRYHEWLNQKE